VRVRAGIAARRPDGEPGEVGLPGDLVRAAQLLVGQVVVRNVSRVAPSSAPNITVTRVLPAGIALPLLASLGSCLTWLAASLSANPQVKTSRWGGSSSRNSPAARKPSDMRTRYLPLPRFRLPHSLRDRATRLTGRAERPD
jgi:hypothetical protein